MPGVDDGAADMAESQRLLDGLAALGYRRLAVTPHYNPELFGAPTPDEVRSAVAAINRERGGNPPTVLTGAEIQLDDRFVEQVLAGELPGIADGPTYLVEFGHGYGTVPPGFEELLFRLQTKEIQLIIAHVERYADVQRDPRRLESLRRSGALIQVNLLSLTGKYGRGPRRTAWRLIEDGAADLVATDLHGAADLEPLGRALEELAELDAAALERLASTNPAAVLDGEPWEVAGRE
jgi:protein-tyrosine phosphatase